MMLRLSSFLLCFCLSCTTQGYSDGPATSQAPDTDPILLRKRVGLTSKELKDRQQHYDCTLRTSQLKDYPQVKSLIDKVAKAPLGVKYLFVPVVPSQEFYAYAANQELVLLRKGDAIEFRQAEKTTQLENAEVAELLSILDKLCPSPKP